jgi:PAS domain S-box-containing protein
VGPGPWAIGFVAAALIALGVVPILMGRRAQEAERHIQEVLEPALSGASDLSLLYARQMARFQAFLLTGDRVTYREPYIRSMLEEESALTALGPLVRGMDLDIRERLALLSSLATQWHVGHQVVFESDQPLEELRATLAGEQAAYDEIRRATQDLERVIESEVRTGRRRMEEARRLQTRIAVALVLLALVAMVVVGLVARQLRGLTTAAEGRRREAVRSRREIDALLEATGDGVLGIALDGRCISLNRVGSELLGYTEMEIRGRDVHDTIQHTLGDGTPRSRESSAILPALEEGARVDTDDDTLWHRRGVPFPARWSLMPLVDGIELRGAVLTFTDMTAIRENEEALRRAVRARDEVVAIVSHDLRNPLGVVAAAADLLIDLPLDEEERNEQASIIARSAARMGRLIEDLLDVTRIEAGALVVRTAQEDPAAILEEMDGVFAVQARDKGLTLLTKVEPGTPRASVDRDRVIQALANLLGNALKFTPPGGTVSVTASAVDGGVAFTVTDTGPGISEEEMQRLFDRFWQAERHDRTGAGLGLAIVRGIAAAHGGRVDVTSTPGEGASLSLVLPAVREVPEGGESS